jgi:hypothetical protein
MPRDDREQIFDKALARQLGSTSAAQGNDCLDAETLAAYHERLLDPEEMAQRKAHIASCERCQEILAQLEATDAIPVEADRDLMLDQIVLEQPDSEATPAGVSVAETEPHLEIHPEPQLEEAPLPMAAAPRSEPPGESLAASEPAPESELELELEIEHEPDLVAASAAPPSLIQSQAVGRAAASPTSAVPVFAAAAKSAPPTSSTITFRSPREDRPKIVRFVAIFGAIAAAVVFWLVFRDQSNKNFELAQNHQQKLEMPPQSPAQSPTVADKVTTPGASEPNAASSQAAATAPAAQPQSAPAKSPTDSATNALDEGKNALDAAKALELKTRKDAAAQAPAFIPGRDEAPNYSSRAARNASSASQRAAANASPVEKALADANAVLHPTSNSPSGIPTTPPPARSKVSPGVVNEAVAPAPNVPGLAQVSTSGDARSLPVNGRNVSTLGTLAPLSVPAPSGKTIWRIGQAGQVQRSTDSGTTWSIQPSGVVTDLIAGSAYSDQVCWLVGRNGTILRTINGGATWQKLASPSNVDLLGVFSINADSATITDAAGRAFETTTGGSHWTRTRLQQ